MIALNIPFGNRILVVCAGIRASRRFMTVRMSFLEYRLTFRSELNSDSNSCAGMNASERYATVGHTYLEFGEVVGGISDRSERPESDFWPLCQPIRRFSQ